jgi:uncharacterized protein (DUF362 family)
MNRRKFIRTVNLLLGGGIASKLLWDYQEAFYRSCVFVARASSYECDLEAVLSAALAELEIGRSWFEGKSVLLKPNLVEPSAESPHINTHPALVRAVGKLVARMGAETVLVAEGPGHVRDIELVLQESTFVPMLETTGFRFIDLNTDDVVAIPNRNGATDFERLHLPRTVVDADVVVSLPKMKTHHWAGVTLSMKNLFGAMPGSCYGWPKNLLHFKGISPSIVDITAAVRPHLAIVDGIVAMEGDGPIMGSPRNAGVIVVGANLPSVDATCARLMGIDPWRIEYLSMASGSLGPIGEAHIDQRGESIKSMVQNFHLPDFPVFQNLRG